MNGAELGGRIQVLADITDKKQAALTQILAICENQHMLFTQPPGPERADFLRQIGVEKQKLIDQVVEMDGVFQSMFAGMAADMERERASHMPAIEALQEKIRAVSHLDAKIRAQEATTRAFVGSVTGVGQKPWTAMPAGKVAEIYRKHRKGGK